MAVLSHVWGNLDVRMFSPGSRAPKTFECLREDISKNRSLFIFRVLGSDDPDAAKFVKRFIPPPSRLLVVGSSFCYLFVLADVDMM